VSEDCVGPVVECPTAILTQIPLIHPIAAVSDRSVRTAARARNAVTPANLLEQVRCSRFRHEPAYWERIGHRCRGALALFDFQPQLSPSTISFARALLRKVWERRTSFGCSKPADFAIPLLSPRFRLSVGTAVLRGKGGTLSLQQDSFSTVFSQPVPWVAN